MDRYGHPIIEIENNIHIENIHITMLCCVQRVLMRTSKAAVQGTDR